MTAAQVAIMSKAFRIGIFVAFALAALSVGIFLIGNKEFLFNKTYRLKTDFPDVGGLDKGAEVRVGGIHEGTVSRIDLPAEPGGKVTVEMKLHSDTQNLIRKDSVASIKTEGLLGDKYIEISFGTEKAQTVGDTDEIAGEVPVDLSTQAKSVAAEAQTGVQAFTENMQAAQHNFLLSGFFKKRGYNDPSELAENSISAVPAGPRSKEFDYDASKIFNKPEEAELKNKKAMKEVGDFLQDNTFTLAVIATSAATGDTGKDKLLTKARSKVIRDYLVQNFKVDDTRLKIIGLGKSKTTEAGEVQILVYGAKPAPPQSASQVAVSH
jgi:outer membrane protein OmpA-like peptidoglycan-associated protein